MTRLTFAMLFALALAGCGGGGSGSGASPAVPAVPGTGGISPFSSTGNISTSGVIVAMFSGGFTLNTGYPHGYIHVFVNPSTQITGPQPFMSENVLVVGTGSWTSAITATSVTQNTGQQTPGPSPSPIPTPQGFVSTQGTIVALSGPKMTINSGYPHGYIPVTEASNVAIFGGVPVMNSYVTISGTGSLSNSVTAYTVSVWSAPPGSVTASGTVVAGTPYGFTANVDGSHPAVPILVNGSTVIAGGSLQAGALVNVTGVGSIGESVSAIQIVVTDPTPAPSPNASPTPTPGPIAQTHLLTSDYLGGIYGTHSIPWAAAAPYLTWAQTSSSDADGIAGVGIKTEMYTDPNRTQSNDPMHTNDESTYSHDCNGNRIYDMYGNITQWLMDPSSSSMQSLYASVVGSQIGNAHMDAFFQDDGAPLQDVPNIFNPSFPCNYSASVWISQEISLTNSAIRPVIINGLNALMNQGPSDIIGVLTGSNNAIGGNYEHCLSDSASPKNNGWLWLAEENTQLQVLNAHKIFECQLRNPAPADQSADVRTYALASFLLTYDPANSILWEQFDTPSELHVMPESQLVALNPVVPEPTDVSALLLNGGVYGREYRACYVGGNFVGSCAVAVNPQAPGTQAPFPYPQYRHTLVLSGAGIIDGGTMAINGPPPPTYLTAQESEVVFQ